MKRERIDALTGLANTNQLVEDLHACLEREQFGYLMVLGIDNFKNINNKYGRAFGNHVLQSVAGILVELMDGRLNVYRLDSDKFAVNAVYMHKKEVQEIYQEIQEHMTLPCTLSSGAARYSSAAEADVDEIYQRAENALDWAKKNGKNTQEFFAEDVYEEELKNVEFQEELKQSILNDFEGFSICYQPQISGKDFQVHGAEALLRYTSPDKGVISPMEFIPVLEQTKMICMVGEWVLRSALIQCREWRKQIPDFRVSVNFSYIQLRNKVIAEHILRLLQELNLPGEALTLEVTESVQLQDYQFFNQIFYKLEKQGVRISIDDFGTGYSSFSYLKSIAINEVKIDRSFVTGIQHSAYNYRLLSNMIELAHSAQIEICCEGVETEEELATLKELHPDVLQGYLFSKPLTVEQFEEKYMVSNSVEYSNNQEKLRHYLSIGNTENTKSDKQGTEFEKMATIIDGMEEIVYVRDQDSYELFYLNDSGRRATGAYDYKGRKCYEVLQNRKSPCELCNKECVNRDTYTVWEFYNQYLDKHYIVKDKLISWMGVDARLTISIDITDREITSRKVQEKLEFEQNIVAATTKLAVENDKDKAIDEVLRMIGEYYDANRAYLFVLQNNKRFWDNTHEWCAEGVTAEIDFLQDVPIEYTQRWNDNFRKGESLVTADIEDIKEISPEEYETLKAQNIKSLITSPIWDQEEVIGFIGVDDPKRHHLDPMQVQTMAYFISDRLQKDYTKKRLGELLTFHSEDVLKVTKLGLWSIRIGKNGEPSQMFADQTMLDVMGVTKKLSPEECYDFWYSRINEGYYHYVNQSVGDMIENGHLVELGYTWKHPEKGEVTVRCVGRRVADSDGMICLEGYHRDINEMEMPTFMSVDQGIIFEFNEKHQSIYFHNERGVLAGDEEREEHFPDCWIAQGLVHPHFVEKFRAVYVDVKNQPEIENEEFLLKTKNGDYDWFHLTTKDLGKDEKDADTMITILKPASVERSMELQHMRLQDFYKATLSEKIAYMEVDLESRHVLEVGGMWNDYRQEIMNEGRDYQNVLLLYREHLIHAEDMEIFEDFVKADLRKCTAEENKPTRKLQFRRMLDGQMRWVEMTIHVFEEQYSENLYALIYLKDIDAEKRQELNLEAAATRDYLTGIFNRRAFEYQVEEHMRTADPEIHSTLIILDVDNFKSINDNFGHAEGDLVLKQLAEVLMTTFRRKDILGRLGGDEFMIFLKNVSDREIIERRIKEFCAAFAAANQYQSTCSIGVVEVEKEGFSYKESLRRADAALYRSKEKGKNIFSYYEE